MEDLTDTDLHNLKHMLGANRKEKSKHGCRNFFAAANFGSQIESMTRLESYELVKKGRSTTCGLTYYHATKKGCEYAGLYKAAIKRALDKED
jgi:hypothetical protein